MPKLTNQPVSFREYAFNGNDPLRVEREQGVIRGTKILGLTSSNGRTYTPDAIQRGARLYEGRVVNINHAGKPNEPRSAYDRFGRIINVRVQPDGLYGDLEYLKSHPMAERVSEAAERMPSIFGMSHDVQGMPRPGSGKAPVIESIVSVRSVDLVCDPATVKSLFEQQEASMEPNGNGASTSPEEQLKAGFRGAMVAVLDDESMDMSGKLAKLKEIMKAQEKIMGGGEKEAPAEEMPAEEAPAKEQAEVKTPEPAPQQLAEQVEQFRRKETVRSLCDQAGLLPSAIQLKALLPLAEEADLKAMIQLFKGTQSNSQKPRSQAPGQPLQEQQAQKAVDGKSLAALLKRRR